MRECKIIIKFNCLLSFVYWKSCVKYTQLLKLKNNQLMNSNIRLIFIFKSPNLYT